MTWEETIRMVRKDPGYKSVITQSYLNEDLIGNTERFAASVEFDETMKLIKAYAPNAKTILDIGAGNGISTIAFARKGYAVTAAEPDPSNTVGCGAIAFLVNNYQLGNVNTVQSYGEDLPFEDESFDIVYARQAMHHAAHLQGFINEAARVLKKGGLLLTVRDHVIFNSSDKAVFLQTHPLQKFYGGENAFTPEEYSGAMKQAGLQVERQLKYFDSPINFFPENEEDIKKFPEKQRYNFRQSLQKRFGSWTVIFPFLQLSEMYSRFKNGGWNDEKRVPGRMHSYVAKKKRL